MCEEIAEKRPKKRMSDEEKRRNRITIRYRDDEFLQLQNNARIAEIPLADYVRKCTLKQKIYVPIPLTDQAFASEIGRVGGLLAALYKTRKFDQNKLNEIIQLIHDTIKKIRFR